MNEIWALFLDQWLAQSWLEITAVLCALMYLILAIKENIWCWFFAFVSTAIYVYLFNSVSLISESLLNIYYLVMAVYGWITWSNYVGDSAVDSKKPIISLPFKKHVFWIVLTGVFVPPLGYLTMQWGASYPYLDAFTTCFAILATFLVAHKVLENWYYWFVINGVSIFLFWQKSLYPTVLLFALYLIIGMFGIIRWYRVYRSQMVQSNA